ncbi:hypothetical protein OS493_029171 [Desmophyllum pertusum]|uniref:Uncharacterized protein n=1 Tax=Desmophyllum pertusum TaxID=174260 RepID=A0A9W9ZXM0_9CNID|nr:hypothetical protein OS493_029171 [Desmophyllum pertusum]
MRLLPKYSPDILVFRYLGGDELRDDPNTTCRDDYGDITLKDSIVAVPHELEISVKVEPEQDCKIRWIHLACVRLKVAPKGNWICPRREYIQYVFLF